MDVNHQPLFLDNMRVERTYTGGKLLDEWQGIHPGSDGLCPEEWVASTITSRYAENPQTGLSVIRNQSYKGMTLKEYISRDPAAILGEEHYRTYGENLGFLTKIIDSEYRLNIQAHPDRAHAKEYFNSEYGKTEAWVIINTRKINDEDPYILLGFKHGITRDRWESLVENQEIKNLESSLHKIPVKPDDVYLIEGGVPHAIGPGCMIVEIQEPTDITFRVEKVANPGKTYPEETYHQGIGYRKMFDCFNYEGYSYKQVLNKAKISSRERASNANYSIQPLIQKSNTPFFSMELVKIRSCWNLLNNMTFSVTVVLKGAGYLKYQNNEFPVEASNEIFLPCSSQEYEFISDKEELELLICYPPGWQPAENQ